MRSHKIDANSILLCAIFLLMAVTSPFISRMLFGVLVSAHYKGRTIPFFAQLQHHMLKPITLLLIALFVYCATLVSFSGFFDLRFYDDALASALFSVIVFCLSFYSIIVGIFAVYRLATFLMEIADAVLHLFKTPPFMRPVIIEFAKLLAYFFIIMFAVWLFVLGLSTNSDGQTQEMAQQVLSLFSSLNWFTCTLIVGLTPFFRDIVAGFTVLSDDLLQQDALVCLVGVTNVGFVKSFGLRMTEMRMLDESVVFVPNSKFMRYSLYNYTQTKRYECEMTFPVFKVVHTDEVRKLLFLLKTELLKVLTDRPMDEDGAEHITAAAQAQQMQSDAGMSGSNSLDLLFASNISVTFNNNFEVVVRAQFQNQGVTATKRLQSELLLIITEMFQTHSIVKLRGPSRTVYHEMRLREPPGTNRVYTE